jgi:ADP-ribosylglycohydrolase
MTTHHHLLRDRFRGALLGTLAGDALGMPVEGWSAQAIRRELGEVREMLPARLGAGTFTDDTQMAAGLALALLGEEHPVGPDVDLIARSFGKGFDPRRGYGGNTREILAEIRAGAPWREAVERRRLPGGSFANGAAMRVAPAALAGFPDAPSVLRIAEAQARPTGHDHPEARLGARLQAVAVLVALDGGPGAPPPDPETLLRTAARGWDGELPPGYPTAVQWITRNRRVAPEEVAAALGVGGRAVESVPAALWAFLAHPDDPEEAIVTAVGMGGDTDTIGAMAGALVGARCGASALPSRWIEVLESGPQGKDGLTELADRLYDRAVPGPGPGGGTDPELPGVVR